MAGLAENDLATLPGPILEGTLHVWGQANKQSLLPITGRSMLPIIRDGDHVLVAHGCKGVRRGDVVVFRQASTLTTHRVLRIPLNDSELGATFITKGDNTAHLDRPIGVNDIVGRVVSVKRCNRHMPMDTPVWRTVGSLIAVSTLTLIAVESWGSRIKQRLIGPQECRFITCLHRGAGTLFFRARQLVAMVVWRQNA